MSDEAPGYCPATVDMTFAFKGTRVDAPRPCILPGGHEGPHEARLSWIEDDDAVYVEDPWAGPA